MFFYLAKITFRKKDSRPLHDVAGIFFCRISNLPLSGFIYSLDSASGKGFMQI